MIIKNRPLNRTLGAGCTCCQLAESQNLQNLKFYITSSGAQVGLLDGGELRCSLFGRNGSLVVLSIVWLGHGENGPTLEEIMKIGVICSERSTLYKTSCIFS